MFGSIVGNFAGTAYFLYFQLAGILLTGFLLKKENIFARLIIGSAFGSLLLMWLPALFAFFFNFTLTAHISAAAAILPAVIYFLKRRIFGSKDFKYICSCIKHNKLFCLLFCATFVLWCWLLHTHIIPYRTGTGLWTGQSTYGDMNMHLGFITSIANQASFPPQYSLFPGTKLAYPFLNAAISSSIYLFGASLRWAYILPMLAAFLQVSGCVYLLAYTALNSRAKAVFTFVLFLFNGGFGFIYFLGLSKDIPFSFKDIFTGYYTTPTNLTDFNIRWANTIADILLPQRASLFGYSILFCCIWLLYQAVWNSKKPYFLYAGIFAAALPLIHTHSFLAIGLISAAWLLQYLYQHTHKSTSHRWYGAQILFIFTAVMCAVQYFNHSGCLSSQHFMAIGLTGIGCCIIYGTFILYRYIKQGNMQDIVYSWGIYLAIVIVLAFPQLFGWTFGQVASGGFLRGHFNWGNLGDFYPWFYIKNLGIPLLLIIGAVCKGKQNIRKFIFPASVIWFVAEFIMFTPNTYDNNKLLYVAYMLLCIAAADFAADVYAKFESVHKHRFISVCAAVCCIFLCTFSALLTLGREAVSEYQIYSQSHLELAEYIEQNTLPQDVIMTNTRHNNEAVALTGRNTVCGADLFLYFHGIDTTQRKEHLALMYSQPAENAELFEIYDVGYVVVSSWERSEYTVDEKYFETNFEKVFSNGNVDMYKLK